MVAFICFILRPNIIVRTTYIIQGQFTIAYALVLLYNVIIIRIYRKNLSKCLVYIFDICMNKAFYFWQNDNNNGIELYWSMWNYSMHTIRIMLSTQKWWTMKQALLDTILYETSFACVISTCPTPSAARRIPFAIFIMENQSHVCIVCISSGDIGVCD